MVEKILLGTQKSKGKMSTTNSTKNQGRTQVFQTRGEHRYSKSISSSCITSDNHKVTDKQKVVSNTSRHVQESIETLAVIGTDCIDDINPTTEYLQFLNRLHDITWFEAAYA